MNARTARAFSLVELLIAITVLAFGLLGIAAVFPVVIAQQRASTDQTLGAAAADFAAGRIEAGDTSIVNATQLLLDLDFDVPDDGFASCQGGVLVVFGSGLWVTNFEDDEGLPGFSLSEIRDDGVWEFQPGRASRCQPNGGGSFTIQTFGPPAGEVRIEPAQRLIPAPYSGGGDGGQPEYVWDPIFRRNGVSELEVAVFVRRLDLGIRVIGGQTLSDVLTGNGGGSGDPRLPVTVGGRGTEYSLPMSFAAYFQGPVDGGDDGRPLNQLIITDDELDGRSDRDDRDRAIRVGQLLLDNRGIVRTVRKIVERSPNGDLIVEVTPPASPAEAMDETGPPLSRSEIDGSRPTAERYRWVQQVVFTEETPAAIRVARVRG